MENQPKNKKVGKDSSAVTTADEFTLSTTDLVEVFSNPAEFTETAENIEEVVVTKNIPVIPEEKSDVEKVFENIESCYTLGMPSDRINCIRNILYKDGTN